MEQIQIVDEGGMDHTTANPQNWIDEKIPAFIEIGRFKSQSSRGGAGMGSQDYLVWIRGYAPETGWDDERVFGTIQYEPETRNKMGQLGAYRSIAPAQEKIDAAVEKLKNRMINKMRDN